MPLLPLETNLYPDDLLKQAAPAADSSELWWVLHTHPRAEKTLARQVLCRGLAFFLPLYRRQWENRGRRFRSHVPLFPGYLFLRGDSLARLAALETNLVAKVLQVGDQAQLHADLVRVHHVTTSGAELTPEQRLQTGSRVQILQGPLAGLSGKVLRQGKQWRLFVEVEFLQQGVSVEIESWMLQPLPTGGASSQAG